MRTIRLALVRVALASAFIGSLAPAPAQATHACDPDLSVLCAHPEDVLDALCDRSALIDKIIERFQPCGTN